MSKQVILLGSAANDGTGTDLRAGGDMINDNFTELYDDVTALKLVTATPCMGSKYAAFRAAIKFFEVTTRLFNEFYYVSKIENGVGGKVIIEVKRTGTLSAAGTLVLKSERTMAARTGWEVVILSEVASSGLASSIIIDWDQLTAATSYICANWPEGGLMAINLYKDGTIGHGATNDASEHVVILTGDTVDIDGSVDQYICNAAAPITLTAKEFADIKGTIKINNISASSVKLYAAASEVATSTFNGIACDQVEIAAGDYAEIMVYSAAVFYCKGPVTITP